MPEPPGVGLPKGLPGAVVDVGLAIFFLASFWFSDRVACTPGFYKFNWGDVSSSAATSLILVKLTLMETKHELLQVSIFIN